MPKFFYIARDRAGKKDSGVEEAATQEELVNRLQSRDLIVINVVPEAKDAVLAEALDTGPKAKTTKHYRITNEDLVLFCRQLATLLAAGVTILKSLDIICQQIASRRLYNIIQDLKKDMEAGLSFHEAMGKYPVAFSELWVNLAESGEASGNLAMVLNRLAGYLERNAAFKQKIISAMIYPMILLAAGVIAVLILTIKIIPTFEELFKGFNLTLPLLTRIIISVSVCLRKYMLLIIIGICVIFKLFRRYIKTKTGRRNYERFLFGLPKFGEFFRTLIIERFTSEMATLVESGVPILYSLEVAEHSVGNLIVADIIRKIKEDVRNGKPLSQPLAKSGFFDPMAVQMINIGEEIGELPNMFKKLNAFYEEYVDTALVRFTSMFEPLIIMLMGVLIGIMVIGMFLPIFQISQIGGK